MSRWSPYLVVTCVLTVSVDINDARAHDTGGWQSLDFVGYLAPFGFADQSYTDVWGSNGHAFLGTLESGVAIIDVSMPNTPVHVATFDLAGGHRYEDVKVHDGIGYFAGSGGVHIVDVSDPQQPKMLSQIQVTDGGFDDVQNVFVEDDLLFQVNSQSSTIKVFDVADSASPTWLRNIDTNDLFGLWDLSIVDDRLYAAGLGGVFGEGAAYVYDVGDLRTNNPRLIGKLQTGSNTASVWPSGDGQYLVTTQREVGGGLSLWDISNLGFPSHVGSANAATYGISSYSAGAVVADDDIVYVAWYEAGTQVLDLDALDVAGTPARIGAYETSLGSSPLDGFVGNRSVFTGLGSDTVLLSDTQWGLYVVDATKVLLNPGDFDADGQLTGNDIDLLTMEIVAAKDSADFDLNGDLIVNTDDLSAWLTSAGEANVGQAFQFGDANLDGLVNASDLNDMALNWLQEVATWTGGDFTADGRVNAADLNVLALHWPNSPAAAAAVPEPGSLALSFVALALLGMLRRRL